MKDNIERLVDAEDLIKRIVPYKIILEPILPQVFPFNQKRQLWTYGYLDTARKEIRLNSLSTPKIQVSTLIHEAMHLYFDYELEIGYQSPKIQEYFIETARKKFTERNPCIEDMCKQLIEESAERRHIQAD